LNHTINLMNVSSSPRCRLNRHHILPLQANSLQGWPVRSPSKPKATCVTVSAIMAGAVKYDPTVSIPWRQQVHA
jgi:hypothetical protein